jgi:phage major head subunit gpT-like protein
MPNVAQLPNISDKAVIGYILQDLEGATKNSWAARLANRFTSSQATETYAGVGNAPMMREWVGAKNAKQLKEYPFTITNKDWESTLEVKRKDLQRDKTGQLMMRTGQLARRAAEHEEKILSALIDAGDGTTLATAYDGKAFFASDHSVGNSGTIDNSIDYNAASTTAPTSTEMSEAIMQAIQAMYGFKDDTGEPTNQGETEFVIMVPVPFWAAAITAVSKDRLSANADNPLLNIGLNLSVVANPRLTWTTKFATFAVGGPSKPLIIQEESAPSVEVLGEGSDWAFHNASHLYSVIKSGNVGLGRFDKAVLTTLT